MDICKRQKNNSMNRAELKAEKHRIKSQIGYLTTYLGTSSPNERGWKDRYIERNDLRCELTMLIEREKNNHDNSGDDE